MAAIAALAGVQYACAFHLAQVFTATDPQLVRITGHCVRLSKTLYFCTPSDGG
jgi:hypothetical protein